MCNAPEEHQLDLLDHVEKNPVETAAVPLPDKGCYEKDEEDEKGAAAPYASAAAPFNLLQHPMHLPRT